jgi:hypothetical protein
MRKETYQDSAAADEAWEQFIIIPVFSIFRSYVAQLFSNPVLHIGLCSKQEHRESERICCSIMSGEVDDEYVSEYLFSRQPLWFPRTLMLRFPRVQCPDERYHEPSCTWLALLRSGQLVIQHVFHLALELRPGLANTLKLSWEDGKLKVAVRD